MRTGKSRAQLKMMEGHVSQDRSAEGSVRGRRCPLGGREGFLNVYDGAMNNTTETFPTLACLSCVFKLVGEQLTRSCF